MLRRIISFKRSEPDAPSLPGMDTLAWRIIGFRLEKVKIALCHRDSALFVTYHEAYLPPNTSKLTELLPMAKLETCDSVDLRNLYPAYGAQFALYREPEGKPKAGVFMKHYQILDLIEKDILTIQGPHPADAIAHEATICERVALRTHPNIAEYLGVKVSDSLSFSYNEGTIDVPLARNSVLGLAFKNYDCTLHELVIQRQKVDVKACLQAVAAGIQHVHSIGIVHGDIRPQHVYVTRGGRCQFVIGDFAAAHEVGSVIKFKTREACWSKQKKVGVDLAQKEDDWDAFGKLKVWLISETGGKLEDYKGIGKVVPKA